MLKIYLDMLTGDSVSVRKQSFDTESGSPMGEPWRRAYINSVQGRARVEAEVADPYKSVIMLMWGNSPTVAEQTE